MCPLEKARSMSPYCGRMFTIDVAATQACPLPMLDKYWSTSNRPRFCLKPSMSCAYTATNSLQQVRIFVLEDDQLAHRPLCVLRVSVKNSGLSPLPSLEGPKVLEGMSLPSAGTMFNRCFAMSRMLLIAILSCYCWKITSGVGAHGGLPLCCARPRKAEVGMGERKKRGCEGEGSQTSGKSGGRNQSQGTQRRLRARDSRLQPDSWEESFPAKVACRPALPRNFVGKWRAIQRGAQGRYFFIPEARTTRR